MAQTAAASPGRLPDGLPVADPEQFGPVAIKAYRGLAEAWSLSNEEAAALLDVADRSWARMKKPGWTGRISQDQLLRVSAFVGLYKGLHLYFADRLADPWIKLPNASPLFRGATPLAYMRAGGLPSILQARAYVDALRGGM